MEMASFCYMTCGWHSDYIYDLWMTFCIDIYIYIIVYLQGIKEKQIKKKQTESFAISLLTATSLPSASWRQRGHVAEACTIWAVAVTIWSVLCRQQADGISLCLFLFNLFFFNSLQTIIYKYISVQNAIHKSYI